MERSQKRLVVFSGVNLVEAGPLSVFKDAVNAFMRHFAKSYDLVLLVNNKNLFKELSDLEGVRLIPYSYPKKQWLLRVWFEYVHCYFISKKLKPYLWFAIHDLTPNVVTKNKVVYCHNSAPFYHFTLKDFRFEKSLFFFKYLYSFFYRINIKSNKYVILQQDWLRNAFEKRYGIKNVIVAYPDIHVNVNTGSTEKNKGHTKFLYPAMPRVFKNYEVLLAASEILSNSLLDFEVIVTIDGTENSYSRHLKEKFQHVNNIKFIGLQPRSEIFRLYGSSDCLVFPSKLESWGLPVTEMKYFDKPILIADAAYAAETVGNYDKVRFFRENDMEELAHLMRGVIEKNIQFDSVTREQPAEPFSRNWKELLSIVLN